MPKNGVGHFSRAKVGQFWRAVKGFLRDDLAVLPDIDCRAAYAGDGADYFPCAPERTPEAIVGNALVGEIAALDIFYGFDLTD